MRPPWCLQRWRSPCDGACWGRWYEFCPETQECPPSSGRSLDRTLTLTLTFTVADLALDEGLALRCDCWVRILGRAELAALVGRDARLHLIGLRRGDVVPGSLLLNGRALSFEAVQQRG